MKRTIFGLLLLLSATPAAAECISVEAAREQIATLQSVTVTELSGKELKTAGDIFKAISGSDAPVETAALVELPDGTGALAIGPSGAICGVIQVPADRWKAFRRSILGLDA